MTITFKEKRIAEESAEATKILHCGKVRSLLFVKEKYREEMRTVWDEFGGYWHPCEFEEFFEKQAATIVLNDLIFAAKLGV